MPSSDETRYVDLVKKIKDLLHKIYRDKKVTSVVEQLKELE